MDDDGNGDRAKRPVGVNAIALDRILQVRTLFTLNKSSCRVSSLHEGQDSHVVLCFNPSNAQQQAQHLRQGLLTFHSTDTPSGTHEQREAKESLVVQELPFEHHHSPLDHQQQQQPALMSEQVVAKVTRTQNLVVLLTTGVFEVPMVKAALISALESGIPLVLVHEKDEGRGGLRFSQVMEECPEDLDQQQVFETLAVEWYNEPDFREISIFKIVQRL